MGTNGPAPSGSNLITVCRVHPVRWCPVHNLPQWHAGASGGVTRQRGCGHRIGTIAYLLRAMREWMIDSATTPEIVVDATHESVDLPRHLAGNDAVVLIISDQATAGLEIGNEWISTRTRFNGAAHIVRIPITAVPARETGHMVPLATAMVRMGWRSSEQRERGGDLYVLPEPVAESAVRFADALFDALEAPRETAPGAPEGDADRAHAKVAKTPTDKG